MRCVFVLSALLVCGRAQTGTLSQLFTQQQTANSALYATSVLTTLRGEVVWGASGAFGQRDVTTRDAMNLDSEARVGAFAEILVVATALTLPQIRDQLSAQISTQFTPRNLAITNPRNNGAVTYEMLMFHTSSIIDGTAYAADLGTVTCNVLLGTCTPDGQQQFQQWLENRLTINSAGTAQINPNAFSETTPGTTVAHAHLNTALLAYIVGSIIQSQSLSIEQYVYENVIQPSGMSDTFYAELGGEIPVLTGTRVSPVWQSMMYDYTATRSQTWRVHPNRFADVHLFSTVTDMLRLAEQIFDQADNLACNEHSQIARQLELCQAGRRMRAPSTGLLDSTAQPNQLRQGLGVRFYDPIRICSQLTASGVFTQCPLQSTHRVWGFMTGNSATTRSTIAGVLCTDASGVTTTNRASCVAIVQGYASDSALQPNDAFAMAGAAFQLAFGQTTVSSTPTSDSTNDLYGLWVGFGVVGTIVFVVAASFFTEFLIQPPPPIGPAPGFRPGQPGVAPGM